MEKDNQLDKNLVNKEGEKATIKQKNKPNFLLKCFCPCLVSQESRTVTTTGDQEDIKVQQGQDKDGIQMKGDRNPNSTAEHPSKQKSVHRSKYKESNSEQKPKGCDVDIGNYESSKGVQGEQNQNNNKDVEDMFKNQSDPSRNFSNLSPQLNKREKKAAQRLMSKWQVQDVPKNQIFVLYDSANKDFVMAKITEKKLRSQKSVDFTNQSTEQSIGLNTTLITDFDGQSSIVPQKVAQYLADRCKGNALVLDGCCGVGGLCVQLARTCDFCVGVDNDTKRINFAKENSKKFGVQSNVEFIKEDFFDLKNIQCDLVFLHPSFDKDKYNLFSNAQPPLLPALNHSYRMAKNIVLLLPKQVDLRQLPTLFYQFYQSQVVEDLNSYTIEIEQIVYNKKHIYYAVYYGQTANFEENEEIEFLQQKLSQNSEHQNDRLYNFMRFLVPKIGIRGIVKYINKAERTSYQEQNQTQLQIFLDLLVSKKIISRADIYEHLTMSQKMGSFDGSLQQSVSFNSKLFQNSQDSNDFQLALSPNNANNPMSLNEEKQAEKVSAFRDIRHSSKVKQTYGSNDIIEGSKCSDFGISYSEEGDDISMRQESNVQVSDENKSKIQKAKSHDVIFMFRGRQSTDQAHDNDDQNSPFQ